MSVNCTLSALSKATLCLLLVAMVGCTSIPKTKSPKDQKTDPAKTKQEVVREYERRRDEIQYQAAVSKARQGDTVGALDLLERLLERVPNHRAAILLTSDIAIDSDNPQQAIQWLQPLVKQNAEDDQVHHALGLAYDGLGQVEKAKVHFAKAAHLAPENKIYRASLEMTDIDDQPLTPPIQRLADRQHDDYDDQIDSANTQEADQKLAEGDRALESGSVDRALRIYAAAMSSAPQNPNIPHQAALRLIQHNEHDAAIELLARASRQFPQSVALLRTLATAHYRQGDYESSQVALQQALSLDNSDALTYFLMGAVRRKLGDHEGSAKSIARAQALDSTLPNRR
jgi:predicted Zn-dependent protease